MLSFALVLKKQQEIQPVITTGGSESAEIMIDSGNTTTQSIQGTLCVEHMQRHLDTINLSSQRTSSMITIGSWW